MFFLSLLAVLISGAGSLANGQPFSPGLPGPIGNRSSPSVDSITAGIGSYSISDPYRIWSPTPAAQNGNNTSPTTGKPRANGSPQSSSGGVATERV